MTELNLLCLHTYTTRTYINSCVHDEEHTVHKLYCYSTQTGQGITNTISTTHYAQTSQETINHELVKSPPTHNVIYTITAL